MQTVTQPPAIMTASATLARTGILQHTIGTIYKQAVACMWPMASDCINQELYKLSQLQGSTNL